MQKMTSTTRDKSAKIDRKANILRFRPIAVHIEYIFDNETSFNKSYIFIMLSIVLNLNCLIG